MPRRYPDLAICQGAVLEDLDPAQIEAYREQLDRRRPGSPLVRKATEELLVQVGAAVETRGRLKPTLTGILFFGRDTQQFYPTFTVTFMQFAGTSTARATPDDPLYLDNREFHGTLPSIIDGVRATIFEKLGKRAVMDGFVRQDVTDYPEFAYREAILNAVSHRDYSLEGSFVQVRLFADRLEVQSPGGLGGHLTVDNIVYEQYTRNPHIVRLLEDWGYVEHRGLGVDRMIAAMTEAGLKAPSFQDRGSSFWVILQRGILPRPQHELVNLGLNDRQVQALAYMQTYGRLTNREFQAEFEVSERTALYDLQGLVDAGLAIPVSSGRGRYYILRD
ncbi:MAG TPA: ATP-binding protein [Anaerolineae bacterium]|nr:ATP-binding protein [Anaerolineae bacterium]